MATQKARVEIKAPNMETAIFKIVGVAPLVMNKFSHKALTQIKEKQMLGSQAKKGKKREPKDFDALYKGAIYRNGTEGGWIGVPATAFRTAMVGACRLVGFTMTHAKLGIFIDADGVDYQDGTPLIKLKGKPKPLESKVRLETGVADIRVRPIFEKWGAEVRIRYDADMFTATDISNLLMRVGLQVGILEGRPNSTKSCGMGWGLFEISNKA